MKRPFDGLIERPIWLHSLAAAASLAAFSFVKPRLDALYAASKHPVDYATGQTTFDGERIKGFYSAMEQSGTLDVYVQTQRFDFLFILSVALVGLCLGSLVGRISRPGSYGRAAGRIAATLAVTGASLDAIENAISFVMLGDPQGFANWLALPYSACASAKFACLTAAMVALLVSLCLGLVGRTLRRPALA